MYYKNTSTITKTFYNVEFKPGDVKEVQAFINDRYMVRVNKPKLVAPIKSAKLTRVESKIENKIEPKAESDTNSEDASK